MRKSFLIVLAFVAPAPAYGSEGVSVQEPRSEPPLLTLADGRYFGYIRAIDTSTVPATLRFDRAEFLSGDEAYAAALADAAIEPGEPVSNDYYVDDPNRRLAQLEIAADVGVTAVRCPNSCRDGVPGAFAPLAASFAGSGETSLADDYRGEESQYWVTVDHGLVTRIDEQYLP